MLGKRLAKNSTIGLVSPASWEKVDTIKSNIEVIKSLGFKIKEGKHIYDKYGYLCGSDKDRADDIMDMFLDKDVDMILSIRGGYGTMRILPLINTNIVINNPKIFGGFSDITTLLNYFASKCNLTTFHCPMVSSNLNDKFTLESFLNTLLYGDKPYSIKNPDGFPSKCIFPGTVEGRLVGGNLSLICSTLGTPYEIDTKDNILFIEDVKEEPYRVDRMLTQLLLAGKLDQCAGFILGQFTNCELPHYERSLTLEQVFEDTLFPLKKPTLINFMSGHSYPKLTLPIGAMVNLNSKTGVISTLEPVVK
ncbi:MAG: peptidase LD-carboxypeptidase [Clostridiaceae bacterium]|nr:peptidase LD-carboxypeptidase [Clostridiaceae bacterium]